MKKILSLVFYVVLASVISINSFAYDIYENTVPNENITIVFENDNLSDVEKERLATIVIQYHLNKRNNDDSVATYGLMCTLFGHNEEVNIISTIEHKVRETRPRCFTTSYEVTTCSRCDYENIVFLSDGYTDCCPLD